MHNENAIDNEGVPHTITTPSAVKDGIVGTPSHVPPICVQPLLATTAILVVFGLGPLTNRSGLFH